MKEWVEDYGGKKKTIEGSAFKPLPYYCCALSLQPFEDPVCTPDGVVFDIT
jgi:peptidyl-prolyl cis-trans isomerase-like protein 2